MSAVMALQEPRPRERLATYFAFARERVGANVHLQRARCHVGLVTALALELGFATFQLVYELAHRVIRQGNV